MTTTNLPITLSQEQQAAVGKLVDFIADPGPPSPFFVFSGYAGTGKTFCMREILARTKGSAIEMAFTAPTNKAAKVLRAITENASTIYSLLGLRVDKNGELKQVVAGKPPEGLANLDVVWIDEGSMVNSTLMRELTAAAKKYNFKVVFMGDPAQLPPVGEAESPIWKLPVNAVLTEVRRHDNQILDLVTEIREVVASPAPCVALKNNHTEDEGVWKLSKADFRKSIAKAVDEGKFADGSNSKIIAWRNVRVGEYNDLVRYCLFGAAAQTNSFLAGDRIVAGGPCERNDVQLLATDDEAIVDVVTACQHPMHPKYRALELKCTTELGATVRLLVCHPESAAAYAKDCSDLADQARELPRLWKKFWELKEIFHDIRYSYAITAHRSQGSTYENVWVDYQDVLLNRNRREAFQCLYVACSRPTTRLVLA
jgi:exodeoxyribonuclease-5